VDVFANRLLIADAEAALASMNALLAVGYTFGGVFSFLVMVILLPERFEFSCPTRSELKECLRQLGVVVSVGRGSRGPQSLLGAAVRGAKGPCEALLAS
jgi:hypothetical protein